MLSSDVGISRSYLGDIEAGRKYPNYVLLSKIAEVCGVSVESLTSDNKEIISVDNFSAYFYDGNNKDELTENEVLALKAYLLLYRQQKQSKEGE
jgi:transcriptional regulator with XRE-family HTH domain